MATTITFFPVDNGDMTLIKFGDADSTTLLIDVNIRQDADGPEEDCRDVAKDLREQLKKDEDGRPYVDAFLLSHPDQDHCRGLSRHFYLGPLEDYPDDEKKYCDKKIVIREIWSSPIVFRRADKKVTLCDDAIEFRTEARRRVQVNRDKDFKVTDGDRIVIMSEDIDGKTDDLTNILVRVGDTFAKINGNETTWFSAQLLAPFGSDGDEDIEECLIKNNSSVIINFKLAADATNPEGANFMTGGDAEYYIWKRLWELYKNDPKVLEYDIMQTPHHCSWHSLSPDSWSEKGEDAKVDKDALNALSQGRKGAIIVASSKPINDQDGDPPCTRAEREYEAITKSKDGKFYCTGEYPQKDAVEPLIFVVGAQGITSPTKKESNAKVVSIISAARAPMPHGANA